MPKDSLLGERSLREKLLVAGAVVVAAGLLAVALQGGVACEGECGFNQPVPPATELTPLPLTPGR
jgi:hypothetical protein